MKIDLSSASNEDATCWQRALAVLQICLMMDLEEVNVFQRRRCYRARKACVTKRYVHCLEGCMGKEEYANNERRSMKMQGRDVHDLIT